MDIVPRSSESGAERLYRRLLICYPSRMRVDAEAELLACFRDSWQEAGRGGVTTRIRFWMVVLLDLLRSAPPEWLPTRPPSPPSPRGATLMDTLLQDFRYALRSFRSAPTLTLVTALTIAIGIGATTTIVGVANALLLRAPAGVVESGKLVTVHSVSPDGSSFHSFSWLDARDLDQAATGLEALSAFTMIPVSLATSGEPELKLAMPVSANYFRMLGLRPATGRFFLPEEDAGPGGPRVAVLGHAEWIRRFDGDGAVIGRKILVNGSPFTVIGVAPPGFRGHIAALDASLWVPVTLEPVLTNRADVLSSRQSSEFELVGRLRPGITRNSAEAALSAVFARLGRSAGWSYDRRVEVRPYAPLPAPAVLPAVGFLGLLLLLAFMVLLIASANVANVLLARAAGRTREIAVRLAVGAGRIRLIRQLVTESVVLFVAGGAGGTLLALWATRALGRLHPDVGMPLALDFSLDARVLLVALGVTLLTGVGFGLVPALQATRPDLVRTLKDAPAPGRRGRFRLRGAFVAAQVAGSTLLLVTAGLFVRALGRASAIDVGFDPTGVETLSVDLQMGTADPAGALAFAERLEARAAAFPGVTGVSTTDFLPLNLSNQQTIVAVPGREERENVGWFQTDFASVSPGYFEVMGMPLIRGRRFSPLDRAGSDAVAVINQTLADRLWPGLDPLGRVLEFGERKGGTPTTVVGLVRNAHYRSLGEAPVPMVFLPFAQRSSRSLTLLVKLAPGAASAGPGLRAAVRALDPALPILRLATFPQVIAVALLPNRIALALAVLFGGTGLLLAAVGLYGVLSYMVSRRRREIGIRMALGAASYNVRNLVMGDGFRLVGIGLLAGFGAAALVSRLLGSLLFGLSPLDPVTYGGIALLFGGVAAIACLMPLRRALHTEPIEVLRHE